MSDEDGFLLARIVIERRLIDDTDQIFAEFTDGDGETPPLVEILGMLTMTVDTAIKATAGEIPDTGDE